MIDTDCPCSMCRKNRAIKSIWRGDCTQKQEEENRNDHVKRWIDSMTPAELDRVRKAIQSLGQAK